MEKPDIVQTKFQKILATVAKAFFWTWLFTISAFVAMTIYGQNNSFFTNYAYIYLGNIGLGVVAFIIAIVAHLISRPRPKQETDALLKTVGLGISGLILLVVLGRIPTSSSGSVNGAKLFASPLPPITTNVTPKPTPTPKAKITTTQPKSPQITCTGPDYKTFQTTEAECIKFRTAWGLSPSATPWPTLAPNKLQTTTTTSTYTPTNYPPCTVYYNILKTTSTYYGMSPEWCASAQKSGTLVSSPIPTPIPTPTPQPTANNHDMCIALDNEWTGIAEDFWANQANIYSSSAEATLALINMSKPYQDALNNLGCGITVRIY